MCELRTAADRYTSLGWQLVAVQGKIPRLGWKKPPARHKVDKLLDDPKTTGLAVILGAPSGDLVVRDFDKPEAYELWKTRSPRTGRDAAHRPYGPLTGRLPRLGTMAGAPLVKLSDGELRGNGGIVVLPPSLHASGACYEWINEPDGKPPVITLKELNVDVDLPPHPSTPQDTQAHPSRHKHCLCGIRNFCQFVHFSELAYWPWSTQSVPVQSGQGPAQVPAEGHARDRAPGNRQAVACACVAIHFERKPSPIPPGKS